METEIEDKIVKCTPVTWDAKHEMELRDNFLYQEGELDFR
jgi:hypothetical protein